MTAPALNLDGARAVLDRALPGEAAEAGPEAGGRSGRSPLGKTHAQLFRTRQRRRRQQVLQSVSSLPRVTLCRRCSLGGSVGVRVKDGLAHLTGVMLCGSPWACVLCAARIRARRSEEVGVAVEQHLRAGGVAFMITLTARHRAGQSLAAQLDHITKAWQRVGSGRAAVAEKSDLQTVGVIRSIEITYGRSGWHSHIHAVLLLGAEPTTAGLARAMHRWSETWRRYLATKGLEPSRERGVVWERVTTGRSAGEYVAKVQDGKGIGQEVTRGDLKQGRLGSLHPYELLDVLERTGDIDALELWREYEQATLGRRHLTWTPGLRKHLLGGVQQTDEQIVEEDVGGVTVARFDLTTWQHVDQLGLIPDLLDAAESHEPWQAIVDLLAPHRLRPHPPDMQPAQTPPDPRSRRPETKTGPGQGFSAQRRRQAPLTRP